MKIYLISLEQDIHRRTELTQLFPKTYPKMQWIKAVNGKKLLAEEYFSYTSQYLKKHHRIITPSEMGCTLSHIQALKQFIKTEEKNALILEDDIIGTDKDIEYIFSIIKQLDKNSILLCGGQTSNGNRNYQLGKKSHIDDAFKLSKFSYPHIYGTCCYAVTRESALQILTAHNNYLKVADNWGLFFLNMPFQIYYAHILHHPDDRTNSHLQKERLNLSEPMNFLQRIKSGRFFIKNFNLLKNHVTIFYLLLIGYRKIR